MSIKPSPASHQTQRKTRSLIGKGSCGVQVASRPKRAGPGSQKKGTKKWKTPDGEKREALSYRKKRGEIVASSG